MWKSHKDPLDDADISWWMLHIHVSLVECVMPTAGFVMFCLKVGHTPNHPQSMI